MNKEAEVSMIPAFFAKQGYKGKAFKFFALDFDSRLFRDFDHSLFASVSHWDHKDPSNFQLLD
jgi:hypothetical protein